MLPINSDGLEISIDACLVEILRDPYPKPFLLYLFFFYFFVSSYVCFTTLGTNSPYTIGYDIKKPNIKGHHR